jgi:hypothetical protein
VFEFATGVFLHQQRYEIADLAGLEPGVLFADEDFDSRGRNVRKLVNQSLLDVRQQRLLTDLHGVAHKPRIPRYVPTRQTDPVVPTRLTGCECDDSPVVDEHDAAQAVELVRALCNQLHEMTRQLSRLERQGVIGTNGRASATIRHEAAALRRDISKAQFLIDRLQRRYLNGNGDTPTRAYQSRGGVR